MAGICPMMSGENKQKACIEEDCMWYDTNSKICCVKGISGNLGGVVAKLENIQSNIMFSGINK